MQVFLQNLLLNFFIICTLVSLVGSQQNLVFEAHATARAEEPLLIFMHQLVSLQNLLILESFLANGALVGSLLGVSIFVLYQIAPSLEAFLAQVTLKPLGVFMGKNVLL